MKLPPIQLGKLRLATNLLLAPVAGYCDLAFRLVARSCGGVGLACTDLLCPEGVLRENRKSMELAMTCPEDSPLCMQLYGANTDRLCQAARWAEDRGAHVIDLNMGCPVDKITKTDGGSALLCNPDNTLRMVEKIIASLRHTPLTCKLRLGWDDSSIVAPYLAARMEALGVAMITIHGRTTAMRFSGQARLDGIAEVVAAVKSIPVIGNGDIRSPQDAQRMLQHTGCAGIMIARGALGAPWSFHSIWTYLTTGKILPEPSLQEKCDLMRHHFYGMIKYRTLHAALCEFRKRISWYARTMHPCTRLRDEMRRVSSVEQFEQILTDFLDWREHRSTPSLAGETCSAAIEVD